VTLPALALLSDEEIELEYQRELASLGIASEEQAHQQLDLEPADDLEAWSRLELEHPLATSVLWQAPDQPWDQRRLVAALHGPLSLVLGGNRSGKTYAILQFCVASALGGDHPAVRAWLADNDLPPDLIPDGPGEVIMATPTAAQSIQLHRQKLDLLLPDSGKVWYGMQAATAGARVEIEVPGYSRPARIWFKSYDQKHRSFKGSEIRLAALTEEPEDEEGKLILQECERGVSSVGGRVVLEMTPQLGFTWVYDDLYMNGTEKNPAVVELDSEFNTMVKDHAGLMDWLNKLTPEQRAMRQKGKFTNLEGLIYKSWTRGSTERFGYSSVCTPFDIPRNWPRFRGGDFGMSDATCIVWGALGDDNTLYVYRYLHEPSPTYQEHAAWVRQLEVDQRKLTGETIEAGWGDPSSGGESAIEAFNRAEVYFHVADKEVNKGISMVAERLRLLDGRPRLKLFTGCRVGMPGIDEKRKKPGDVAVTEMETYRWDPKVRVPQPIKKNDHFCDALRYLVVGVDAWRAL
jgi:hypothetical protein